MLVPAGAGVWGRTNYTLLVSLCFVVESKEYIFVGSLLV